ncbi:MULTISPECIES: hypothetical protein [unclassified Chelatococcus]|uniref:hypothetical protein n=1 Tax=unclassified Chelatococcus TaxID=2638111 RepID=UPI001BCEEF9E|nr:MULTISPECIES: hypothetical protein [unclassified Chelatococcus]MBS7697579.1 hypothetical protein [Chelatococcus sp. YT9]MBX3559957.1 hypothetical protein [Chelatococcus sp.]
MPEIIQVPCKTPPPLAYTFQMLMTSFSKRKRVEMAMEIRSISLNPDPQPTASGARVICGFDLVVNGIQIRNLALVELARGDFGVWSPRSNRDRMPTSYFDRSAREAIVGLVRGHLENLRVAA